MAKLRPALLLLLCAYGCPSNEGETADAGAAADAADEPIDASFNPDQVMRGQQLFRNLRCANCHGLDGKGTTTFPGGPNLIGRTVDDLVASLITPCADPGSFENCHPLKLPDLERATLEDIAAYLGYLGGQQPDADPGPRCDEVPGHICTVIGNGVAGHKSGAQMGREQFMFWPQNTTVDPQGRLVATDWNNYVFKRLEKEGCVDGDCPLTNVIGTTQLGDSCSRQMGMNAVLARDGSMNHPVGIEYLDEVFPNSQGSVILWGWHQWKIKFIPITAGEYGEMYCVWGAARGFSGDGNPAGTGRGTGPTQVTFNLPSSAVWDRDGNFYISDQANLRIRRILKDADDVDQPSEMWAASRRNNVITTWAGGEPIDSSNFHHKTDVLYTNSGDGQAVSSTTTTFRVQFGFDALPQLRLAFDRLHNFMYVADAENGRIRRIDFNQTPPVIDTYAGCAGTGAPEVAGCTVEASNVPATQARLYRPADVDVIPDGSGDVLITDVYNNCVRVVQYSTRKIFTVAGVCGKDTYGYSGDGGPATAAKLAEPGGAGAGPDRTIYIADTLNHRIRRVNPMALPN